MSHLSEEQLVLHYYGEMGDEASIESHLATCDSCRTAYRELQQALALVSGMPVPERPADYGSLVWRRIRPHLGLRPRVVRLSQLRPPRWALVTVMASLLVATFLVGRYWPRPEPPVVLQQVADDAGRRILLASAADHIEQSQIVLMDLAHLGGESEFDLTEEQSRARELLEFSRIYRQTAERVGETGLASILDDLERTLLEIVHSPARIGPSELNEMQKQLESEGILFKLRVISSHMRERQSAIARELGRRSV